MLNALALLRLKPLVKPLQKGIFAAKFYQLLDKKYHIRLGDQA
ncbi:MAG TPA: hypothetical protein VL125_15990 [Pelobium sp.]|nr:hypothetical protein [Pelobium sp.]